ncbi:hypothetical protein Sme01_62770 [Sphaerisporangium melleum]|uniref:Uncharacterized protein n=1 Tax=Sphaerisporangium melleum TaxID=321316 RepID=A0A917VH97_9ACTN|nr:hypothetical protein [Sphaerisporangium melleum]GGK81810.1 hypothetical protein GCM10007964_25580 [Sphaerisporangium melleum]GII73801.1 hypothetical protein Sme01_62770 [Sphaerisporangium melleum]
MRGASVPEVPSRTEPGAGAMSVQSLERRDGVLVVYVDAGDVVVFLYASQPTASSTQAGEDLDAIVVDVHRRTEAGDRRLRLLLDGSPVQPLPLAASFTPGSASSQRGDLALPTAEHIERHSHE